MLSLNGLSTMHKALDERYRTRGTAIHAAAEACAEGFTPVVAAEHQGYVDSLRGWFQRVSPTIVAIERRIVSRLHRLTGRIDLVAIIDGKVWIIDIKTGSDAVHYKWQTALYAVLVNEDTALWADIEAVNPMNLAYSRRWNPPHEIGRACLFLSGAGKPGKWKPHQDPTDLYVARAALALVQIRHDNGLLTLVDPEQPEDDIPAVVADQTAF